LRIYFLQTNEEHCLRLLLLYNVNKRSNLHRRTSRSNLDKILKSILRRQIPFLIGGTITGIIMTYYYGFPFTIIVNSAIWYGISFVVNKYYWKSTGFNDQKYLIQYARSKINSRKKKNLDKHDSKETQNL
jgi:ABC-type transport system involved in Fe-S cluster assembly fused permease/ATPase subunit